MARMARFIVPGLPHHVTQRGNHRMNIFLNDRDRLAYLSFFRKYAEKYGASVFTYCLMHNHIHFIITPLRSDSIAKTIQISHMQYAKYFNETNRLTGHLWHCRFYSCTLSDSHLINAARYVERNPVRAGLVEKPWEWKWSSAAFHSGTGSSAIPVGDLFNYIDIEQFRWKEFVGMPEDCIFTKLIQDTTKTGRPAGPEDFINQLELRTGRIIKPHRRGRPRKQ